MRNQIDKVVVVTLRVYRSTSSCALPSRVSRGLSDCPPGAAIAIAPPPPPRYVDTLIYKRL